MKVIRLVKNATAKKDTESTSLYRQGETPKAQDIVDGPKDGAKTEDNAKALAQKIYDVLNSDSKLSDLIKAKYAQIQVSYKGDKWAFNVDVYKEKKVHHQALKNHLNLRLHQVLNAHHQVLQATLKQTQRQLSLT